MSDKNYSCESCKKNYKSYVGFWKHNKAHHPLMCNSKESYAKKNINKNVTPNVTPVTPCKNNEITDDIICKESVNINKSVNVLNETNKYKCVNCNKDFKYRQNKYKHQLNCNENKIAHIENKLQIIESKLEASNIHSVNNIVNNYNYNNTINNTANFTSNININKVGSEDINELTYDEVKTIFRTHTNCLITLINTLNFNERLPNNHSFCVTSLDGKYVSVYNTDKNSIEKRTKKNFYDEIFNTSIDTMHKIFNSIKNKVSKKKATNLESMIQDVKMLVIENSKIKNTYNNELNLLSYNNRDMVLNSWEKILAPNMIEDTVDDDSGSESSKDSFYYLTDSD